MSDNKSAPTLGQLAVGMIGFLLVFFIESDILAAEIVVFITFSTNIAIIHNEKMLLLKNKIRNLLTIFVFGALAGILAT